MTLLLAHLLNILSFFQQPQSEIIDGYINKMSAYPGDSIELYLNAKYLLTNYNIKLHDLSEKEVARLNMTVFPQTSLKENSFEAGFEYKRTKKVIVPELKSGVYLWENKIPLL